MKAIKKILKVFGAYFPPISAMMRMNNLCRVKALRSIECGDYDTAFRTLCDLQNFFSLCAENPSTLVEFLVGIGTSGSSCEMFATLANADGVSDEMLEKIAKRLEAKYDESSIVVRPLKGEYQNSVLVGLEAIGRMPFTFDDLSSWPIIKDFAFNSAMTRQLVVKVFRDELSGVRTQVAVADNVNYLQPNWAGQRVIGAILPAFDHYRDVYKRCQFSIRTARTAVAVIRYARAHDGQGPQALSELVPTYLNEVPRDPFDQERELGYDREKGIVWSVGKDRDFDPLVEKVKDLFAFNRDMEKYARRIDGKPIEMRQPDRCKNMILKRFAEVAAL